MDIEKIFRDAGLSAEMIEKITPFREELTANSSDDLPFFMEREFYEKYYLWCQGPDESEIFSLMAQVAEVTAGNSAASRYASMLHYIYFHGSRELYTMKWESPVAFYGENAGIFNLMLAISSLGLIRQKHAQLGLDEDFTLNAAQWIGGMVPTYAAGHKGCAGFMFESTYWLRFALDGKLFRIGRLEYLPGKISSSFPLILRHKKDGRIAVLCRNWTFDADNFRVSKESGKVDFTAELKISADQISGVVINACGFPERDRCELFNTAEWETVCDINDDCMTLHIPGGGGMTMEKIRESLIAAKKFFRDVLKQEIKIFTCESWIFNPAWERELPHSNLAGFQRNVFMTPCPEPEGSPGCYFVYGKAECDPRDCDCTSSLHRAFCRIFDNGEPLRSGCMFILPEHLEHFGIEFYRRMEF